MPKIQRGVLLCGCSRFRWCHRAGQAKDREQQQQVATAAAAAQDVKKRSTMKDKTKDKRAKGQAGISDTAKGYWKSEQVPCN